MSVLPEVLLVASTLGKESATEVRNVPTLPQKLNLNLQVSEIWL